MSRSPFGRVHSEFVQPPLQLPVSQDPQPPEEAAAPPPEKPEAPPAPADQPGPRMFFFFGGVGDCVNFVLCFL